MFPYYRLIIIYIFPIFGRLAQEDCHGFKDRLGYKIHPPCPCKIKKRKEGEKEEKEGKEEEGEKKGERKELFSMHEIHTHP